MLVNKKTLKISVYRFLILENAGRYYVVTQRRKGYQNSRQALDERTLGALSHSDNEDANWLTTSCTDALSVDNLLNYLDKLASDLKDGSLIQNDNLSFPGEELQFIVRKYLLSEGIDIPGVIDILSTT